MTQTQEEQQAMKDAYAALDAIETDERASRASVLSVVKARVDRPHSWEATNSRDSNGQ
jgi:hypothetical protein